MEVIFHVVGRAVLSFREALFFLEIISATWASPCNKSWLDADIAFELMSILIEFLDEVEGALTA